MKVADALETAKIQYDVFAPKQFCSYRISPFDVDLRSLFADLFYRFDAIIAVMAVGIVVRSIAPNIADKRTDPAVIVIDDLGKYTISLLSGHSGGANRLTKIVAQAIGAIPVITTATELLDKKSVEEIAEEHDLNIVNCESLTRVNSAIVNERKLLFVTNGGITCPKIEDADPMIISNVEQLKEIMKNYDAGIFISPSVIPLDSLTDSVALLVPKSSPRLFAEGNGS